MGILEEYVEVETGKRNSRPELQKALASCKRQKATLIIAKLDRLGRNVAFIAVDNPHASKMVLHALAAFAENERGMISQRTKEALAAAKARGVELGANGKILGRQNKENADTFALSVAPIIDALKKKRYNELQKNCTSA